jgi:hypothetical protein
MATTKLNVLSTKILKEYTNTGDFVVEGIWFIGDGEAA